MSLPSIENRFCPRKVLQELLEDIDLREPPQQPFSVHLVHGTAEALRLHRLPQPEPLLGHVNVPEVIADRLAVQAPQLVRGLLRVGGALRDRPSYYQGRQILQVFLANAVEAGVERGISRRLATERVKLGRHVPEVAYVPDELGRPDVLLDIRRHPASAGGHAPVGASPWRTPGLEELAGLFVDGARVLPVHLVKLEHVAEVRPIKLALGLSLQQDHTLTSRLMFCK